MEQIVILFSLVLLSILMLIAIMLLMLVLKSWNLPSSQKKPKLMVNSQLTALENPDEFGGSVDAAAAEKKIQEQAAAEQKAKEEEEALMKKMEEQMMKQTSALLQTIQAVRNGEGPLEASRPRKEGE